MIKSKRVLGIIPARGGSKRLPRKHLLPLGNISLIAHSIGAARDSKYLDSIIVSTDSEEISGEARKLGADVPFLRPDHLATDAASSMEVVSHALKFLNSSSFEPFEIVVLLQPTSPFRTAVDIDSALEIFVNDPVAVSLLSVVPVKKSPLWMHVADDSGHLAPLLSCESTFHLGRVFCRNGALYIMRTSDFLKYESFFITPMAYYVMNEENSIDIDDASDLELARTVLRNRGYQG